MKKKFLSVGLMAILAFTSIPYCNVNAETQNGDTEEVLIIEEEEQINDIDYSTEAIILEGVELSDVDYDDLNELLDDGVSIFKTNENMKYNGSYFFIIFSVWIVVVTLIGANREKKSINN